MLSVHGLLKGTSVADQCRTGNRALCESLLSCNTTEILSAVVDLERALYRLQQRYQSWHRLHEALTIRDHRRALHRALCQRGYRHLPGESLALSGCEVILLDTFLQQCRTLGRFMASRRRYPSIEPALLLPLRLRHDELCTHLRTCRVMADDKEETASVLSEVMRHLREIAMVYAVRGDVVIPRRIAKSLRGIAAMCRGAAASPDAEASGGAQHDPVYPTPAGTATARAAPALLQRRSGARSGDSPAGCSSATGPDLAHQRRSVAPAAQSANRRPGRRESDLAQQRWLSWCARLVGPRGKRIRR
jgi:hypothetical protein